MFATRRQWAGRILHLTALCALPAALALAPGLARAQDYPAKPIKIIVPFAPGGTTDIIARIMAEPLSKILGQSVVVENKAGAGGAIGAKELLRAKPDGYTLGIATVSATASGPAIDPNIGFNPVQDFSYVTNIAATPNIIAVHPSFPKKDYQGFLAELKAHPTQYAYASSGIGGIGHMQTELYKSLAKVHMTHIPYRGAGPALTDTIAGQVQILFDNLPSTLPHIKSGRLVPIVVAAPHRLEQLPDVPTFKEVGLEPVNRMAFFGIQAPKGLPADISKKLHDAVQTALKEPAVRKRIEDTGSIIVGNTPQQFTQQIADEFKVYQTVVQKQGLKMR